MDAERRADEVDFTWLSLLYMKDFGDAAAYSERLRRSDPTLTVLLLTDSDVYVPQGVLVGILNRAARYS